MPADQGQAKKPGKLRVLFRWARRLLLVLLLVAAFALLWLNYIGLPGFARSRILAELKARNFDLTFARLRLDGISHIIVEKIRFNSAETNLLPRLRIERAEVLLDTSALAKLQLDLRGLRVHDGAMEMTLHRQGVPPEIVVVTNAQTELQFLPGGRWELIRLTGKSLGTEISVSASVKNALALRPKPQPGGHQSRIRWEEQLADVLELVRALEFASPPKISVRVSGDAKDWSTLRASVRLTANQIKSRWGSLKSIGLEAAVFPTNQTLKSVTSCALEGFDAEWAGFHSAELRGEAAWESSKQQQFSAASHFTISQLDTKWGRLNRFEFDLASRQKNESAPYATEITARSTPVRIGSWKGTNLLFASRLEHSVPVPSLPRLLSRWLPGPELAALAHQTSTNELKGDWNLGLESITTPRFSAAGLFFIGEVQKKPLLTTNNLSLGFWPWLWPYQIPWQGWLSNITTEEVTVGSVDARGFWQAPQLALSQISAQLYGGGLTGTSRLDVVTREMTASAKADFDYHKVALLLEPPVRRWLGQFSWEQPPEVVASFKLQFPGWTNSWTNLNNQLLPKLEIAGHLNGAGAFRGVPADSADTHFAFSNYIWSLPDLVVKTPRGNANLAYRGNVTNAEFYWKLDSKIDPGLVKPLFPKEQHLFFDVIKFQQAPHIHGEVWGNYEFDDRLGFDVQLAATNFLVKGYPYSDLGGHIYYTNLIFECTNVVAHRGAEEVRAPYLRADVVQEVMWVTNAISNTDPYIGMKIVGEDIYRIIEPYQFATPPSLRISGFVPLRHYTKADLHFEVAGHDFSFWKFHVPSVVGDIYWKGDYLSFSNVQASFYQGEALWSGSFVFDKENDSVFSFTGHTTNSDLRTLVADIIGKTNHMEGIVSGALVVSSARSDDDKSWNGFGDVQLRDGFLWNVPVFGVFSPLLDALSPGWGMSRVSGGFATYQMTNSVIYSKDLEVRAPAFRLKYDGKVDLDGNIQADVEALLLRDAWVLGKVFSMALWPVSKVFEARVTGTVENPKTRLKYVPRFLLAPLRALNALKNFTPPKAGTTPIIEAKPPSAPADAPK